MSEPAAEPTAAAEPTLVSLPDIQAAAIRLRGVTRRTPLLALPGLAGAYVKAENLQPTGAFKLRGAYNAIASLTARQRARGVVTHSSGNHGFAVAYAARLAGTRTVVVMPDNAPEVKLAHVRMQGAEIVRVGPSHEERMARAHELAQRHGLQLIPSADDMRVIAGQGTAGLEIVEQLEEQAAGSHDEQLSVFVPIGAGGLASGVGSAIKSLRPSARVIGVEPALAADARDSLAAGRIVGWSSADVGRTMADGLRIEALGPLCFSHLRRFIDEVLTVEEEEIAEAIVRAATDVRLVLEPSGAVSLAGLVRHAPRLAPGTRVALLSGGNVDMARYAQIIDRYHRP